MLGIRSALRVLLAVSMSGLSVPVTAREIVVGVIDVGAPRNIGWAICSGGKRFPGTDLDEFVGTFAAEAKGRPAALGFEAPLFIPAHKEFLKITSSRTGEGDRPWSAGAGATVTTIGVAVMLYTLAKLRPLVRADRSATLDWKSWPRGDDLLVFEAFVSGKNHGGPNEHARDALTAASGFLAAIPNLDAVNKVTADDALSLVGACLAKTKWVPTSEAILSATCLVIRPVEMAMPWGPVGEIDAGPRAVFKGTEEVSMDKREAQTLKPSDRFIYHVGDLVVVSPPTEESDEPRTPPAPEKADKK